MQLLLQSPYRFSRSPIDMDRETALSRFSRGFAGAPPVGTFGSGYFPVGSPQSGGGQTAGWFGGDGTPLPAAYTSALNAAKANGYSVAFQISYAGVGAAVDFVNPDGTIVRVFDWQNYPPQNLYGNEFCYGAGSAATCHTFVMPPLAAYQQMISAVGAETAAAFQAANVAAYNAASAAAAAASTGSGVNPASYGQTPSYLIDRCSLNYANQRVQFTSQYPTGIPLDPGTQVTRTVDCSCPSAGLDASWNPGGVATCSGSPTGTPQPQARGGPQLPIGTLTFQTSRGGNQVQPGDTFVITISGAAPNSPVSVYGVHPDGGTATNTVGQTDGNGYFSLPGVFGANTIGTWQETWYVGGNQVGSPFSFTVSNPPSPASGGTVPTGTSTYTPPSGGGSVPGGGTGGQGAGGSQVAPPAPDTIFGIKSEYVLGGAAGLILLLALGGRH